MLSPKICLTIEFGGLPRVFHHGDEAPIGPALLAMMYRCSVAATDVGAHGGGGAIVRLRRDARLERATV